MNRIEKYRILSAGKAFGHCAKLLEKQCKWMVLRDGSDEDMKIYCHLEECFEEVNK